MASDRKASKMISELTSESDDNQLLKRGETSRDGPSHQTGHIAGVWVL